MSNLEKTIVALDNMDQARIHSFLEQLDGRIPTIKVGLELFLKYGTDYLDQLQKIYPCKIFLDLKLHDIPNTVYRAILSLKGAPIHLLTVHTQGGEAMLRAAMKATKEALPETKILGVSYLTSLGHLDLNTLYGIEPNKTESAFQKLFTIALETKIDGIVLSAHELKLINSLEAKSDHSLLKVCPGIRFPDEIQRAVTHDQQRVLSPTEAVENGADLMVIGRSLTACSNLEARLDELTR
ncbi:MAG: orotidine-5'-phosphate decarboxylase [Bdellovibrionales bacterium]|nr:orotidine-5'-phosphate decarboxylase [Bdellovibrionales bacterium]MBT3527468.1 orotidine-5'-phosphate decarboxylase [Bdellovibrionales bacterium]MBT7766019.1 orotidine-5'-phosphate decarboxylase [Bdellovibrionales bacterium]